MLEKDIFSDIRLPALSTEGKRPPIQTDKMKVKQTNRKTHCLDSSSFLCCCNAAMYTVN